MEKKFTYSVFTKPWKTQSVDELGKFVSDFGFDGIEFPLREGYQLEPDNAEKGLPELVKKFDAYSIKITSVASSTDEKVFAGCAAAGIPIIRIMVSIDPEAGYMASEAKAKKHLESIVPLCEKYGVKVGIQHHYGWDVQSAMGLLHLIEDFDPKYIGAIWDAAHSGLAGEEPEMGLDIVWSHLCMVNLKNAFYRRSNGPEAAEAEWERYFTTGQHGLGSWSRIAKYLKKRNYSGVLCLTAEYSDEELVNEYIAKDIAYAKSLFE
jgi:sugar phosphate isomerase/epimerase